MRIDRLKVGTWNVALPVSNGRRGLIGDIIKAAGADIWVFTEMHDGCATGMAHSHSSAQGRDGGHGPGHRWVTIASRFPLEPIDTSDHRRTDACRLSLPGGEYAVVYGTVLPWMGGPWRGLPSKGGVAFSESVATQKEDWRRMMYVHQDEEFFLIGDMNQDLAGSRYYGSVGNRKVLTKAFDESGLKPLTGGADDPVHRDSAPCACIDHICARKETSWNVTKTERWPDMPKPDRSLSDHFCICVTLER